MSENYKADCKNPSYLLKIRGGVEVDSYGKKAGKGALIAEDISHTLGTSQDQYLFQAMGFCHEEGAKASGIGAKEEQSPTLRVGSVPAVCYEVEMEVAKRKYEVDIERLKALLRSHKTMNNKEIAERLDQPMTLVEHWFRADKYFAIPQPEIWMKLKALLGIETDEFDKSIMEFEFVGGAFDMSNRIWAGEVAPTLTQRCDDYMLVPNACGVDLYNQSLTGEISKTLNAISSDADHVPCVMIENHPADSRVNIDDSGTCQTLTSRMGTGGGNVPLVMFSKQPIVCETYHCNTEIEKSPPLKARDWKDPLIVVYPTETTGSLMASGYNKLGTQEAANDMYIVEKITRSDVENKE